MGMVDMMVFMRLLERSKHRFDEEKKSSEDKSKKSKDASHEEEGKGEPSA